MELWCFQVLLVLCLGSCVWSVVEADDQNNYKDHCCTYFLRLDWNGDLRLTIWDFISLADAIVRTDTSTDLFALLGKVSELVQQLVQFFPLVGENILSVLLSNGVSLRDYLTKMDAGRNTPDMIGRIEHLVDFIHKTFNSQGAGLNLTKGEFVNVYKVFRIDLSQVESGWKDMDKNGDGVVTQEECNNSAQLYFGVAPLDGFSNTWAGQTVKCVDLVKGDLSKLEY